MTDNGICTVINVNASDMYAKPTEDVVGVLNDMSGYSHYSEIKNPSATGKSSALRIILTAPQSMMKGKKNKGRFRVSIHSLTYIFLFFMYVIF